MKQTTVSRNNNFDIEPNLTEGDILMSLESAISSYNKRDFKTITKESLSKSKAPKRLKVTPNKASKIISKSKVTTRATKNKSTKSKKSLSKISDVVYTFIKSNFNQHKKQLLTVSLSVIMLAFVGLTSYIAYAYVAGTNNDIVEKVSTHVILPANETPKVYIIQSEKSEIFQNPLFSGIKVGDNVLSYPNEGKVIIYRGSEDKVVNIVNTSVGTTQ